MELPGLPSLPVWLWPPLLVLAILAALLLYTVWTHRTFVKLGIPGPPPGLFGVMADYKAKGLVELDTELTEKYGHVVGIFSMRTPSLLVTDPDIVQHIFIKDFPNFVNKRLPIPIPPSVKKTVAFADDADWKFQRSLLSTAFTASKLREMMPLIHRAIDNLMNHVRSLSKSGDSIDMKELFGGFTMDAVASTGFGVEVDSQNDPDHPFIRNARRILVQEVSLLSVLCALFPFLKSACEALHIYESDKQSDDFFREFVDKAIRERQGDGQKRRDLLQLMLDAHTETEEESTSSTPNTQKRALTREELVANATLFLLAAHDTAATALTFVCYLLATNPECQARLVQEIMDNIGMARADHDQVLKLPYLDRVLCESLRIYPPAARISRVCARDTEVKGITIPRDMEVHVSHFVIHHRPDLWPDPWKFDPDRFLPENKANIRPGSYLPFGAGPRNCVGMRLAQLEVKVTLVTLLQHFRLSTTPDTEIPPALKRCMGFVHPANPLLLKLEPRNT